jgi:hypothetical protein
MAQPITKSVLEVVYRVDEEECKKFESHLRPRLADVLALPGPSSRGSRVYPFNCKTLLRTEHNPALSASLCIPVRV